MKKRVLSVLLVGAMAVSMLAGCGDGSDAPAGNAGTEAVAGDQDFCFC